MYAGSETKAVFNMEGQFSLVLPAKIFEVKEKASIRSILGKLKGFREEELHKTEDGKTVSLITEVLDLRLDGGIISGVFSKDFMRNSFYRRKMIQAPVTEESPFWIMPFKGRLFMILQAPSVARGVKKLLTNFVANKMSKVLFITTHAILEVKIPHATLKELHESNPQATKLIWFDQVDLPGVEKLCLAGPDIVDTSLYREYLEHGKIWYVVFEVQKRSIVVGITRNCVVTLFSKSTAEEFIKYINEDLLMLV